MSTTRIDEAISRLETILDRHICFSRREELEEVLKLLRVEKIERDGSVKI